MRFYFSGEAGKYFHPNDKTKSRIKKDILNYIENYEPTPDMYSFEFRAVDGFSVLALETVMMFINTHPVNCKFWFRSVFAGDFEALPTDVQEYYQSVISELVNRNIPVRDDIEGTRILERHDKRDIADFKLSYKCRTDSGANHVFISYFEENTKDNWIKYESDTITSSPIIINLCDVYYNANNYIHSSYSGIRKRTNSSKYYYRINAKLPDGTLVKKEKGSFFTAREADIARRNYLISLTTQDCENADRTVNDVFSEFIGVACKDKESLKKKYMSYYNSQLKNVIGKLKIGETKYELERVYKYLKSSNVKDNRSKNNRCALSKGYVAGLRAMLCNFFDYAYNMRYIKSHPMYALPEKWGLTKETNKKD